MRPARLLAVVEAQVDGNGGGSLKALNQGKDGSAAAPAVLQCFAAGASGDGSRGCRHRKALVKP